MLQTIFTVLMNAYTHETAYIQASWDTLQTAYSAAERQYHNLNHLEYMYEAILPLKPLVQDWDSLLFALFYHDIVYSASSHSNEEDSAAAWEGVARHINFPEVKKVSAWILATKAHLQQEAQDLCILLDADLAILGGDAGAYGAYAVAIRKEYAIYPDEQYIEGRKKVLRHFMDMERIYKTDYFHHKLDQQARQNLERECRGLSL